MGRKGLYTQTKRIQRPELMQCSYSWLLTMASSTHFQLLCLPWILSSKFSTWDERCFFSEELSSFHRTSSRSSPKRHLDWWSHFYVSHQSHHTGLPLCCCRCQPAWYLGKFSSQKSYYTEIFASQREEEVESSAKYHTVWFRTWSIWAQPWTYMFVHVFRGLLLACFCCSATWTMKKVGLCSIMVSPPECP